MTASAVGRRGRRSSLQIDEFVVEQCLRNRNPSYSVRVLTWTLAALVVSFIHTLVAAYYEARPKLAKRGRKGRLGLIFAMLSLWIGASIAWETDEANASATAKFEEALQESRSEATSRRDEANSLRREVQDLKRAGEADSLKIQELLERLRITDKHRRINQRLATEAQQRLLEARREQQKRTIVFDEDIEVRPAAPDEAKALSGLDVFLEPANQAACDRGDAEACHNVARAVAERDPAEAIPLYEPLCESGRAWSCQNLGKIYFESNDFENAARVWTRGCKTLRTSCRNLTLAQAKLRRKRTATH